MLLRTQVTIPTSRRVAVWMLQDGTERIHATRATVDLDADPAGPHSGTGTSPQASVALRTTPRVAWSIAWTARTRPSSVLLPARTCPSYWRCAPRAGCGPRRTIRTRRPRRAAECPGPPRAVQPGRGGGIPVPAGGGAARGTTDGDLRHARQLGTRDQEGIPQDQAPRAQRTDPGPLLPAAPPAGCRPLPRDPAGRRRLGRDTGIAV